MIQFHFFLFFDILLIFNLIVIIIAFIIQYFMFVNRVSGFTAHDELATVFSFCLSLSVFFTFFSRYDVQCAWLCAKAAKFYARQSENVENEMSKKRHIKQTNMLYFI